MSPTRKGDGVEGDGGGGGGTSGNDESILGSEFHLKGAVESYRATKIRILFRGRFLM